jgi:hypothetical protein
LIDGHPTPEHDQPIMRIQLVGVVTLMVSVTAVTIAFNNNMRGKWPLLMVAIVVVGIMLIVSTLLVARIQHHRARDVLARGLREIGDDATKFVRRFSRR